MGSKKMEERMSPEQMSKFLKKHDLSVVKQTKRRGSDKIILQVRPETGEDRQTAASRIAFETHLHSWVMGSRPVIDDPEIEPYELQFKDAPGAGKDKRGSATQITAMQEIATAFTFYSVVELGEIPSIEQIREIFPSCDDTWYTSFIKSAKAFRRWLGPRKGYVYSRGTTSFPDVSAGDVHEVIKQGAKALGFASADSWNPSDIYICKRTKLALLHTFFDKLQKSELSQDDKLQKVNSFLAEGLTEKTLIGISLKKVSKKKDATVESPDSAEKQILPEFTFEAFPLKMDVPTVSVKISDEEGRGYLIRLGSNQPSMIIPIIVEFAKVGSTAQIGKATRSPQVTSWFERYGLERPHKKEFEEWKDYDDATLRIFKKKATLISKILPGTRFNPRELEDLVALGRQNPDDFNIYRTINIKYQQLIYGELFCRAIEDGAISQLLQDWYLAAKKNTKSSAPFIKITDLV